MCVLGIKPGLLFNPQTISLDPCKPILKQCIHMKKNNLGRNETKANNRRETKKLSLHLNLERRSLVYWSPVSNIYLWTEINVHNPSNLEVLPESSRGGCKNGGFWGIVLSCSFGRLFVFFLFVLILISRFLNKTQWFQLIHMGCVRHVEPWSYKEQIRTWSLWKGLKWNLQLDWCISWQLEPSSVLPALQVVAALQICLLCLLRNHMGCMGLFLGLPGTFVS